jgi:hypothetical protein
MQQVKFILIILAWVCVTSQVRAFSLAEETLMQFTLFRIVCEEEPAPPEIVESVIQDIVKEKQTTKEQIVIQFAEAASMVALMFSTQELKNSHCSTMRETFVKFGLRQP